jgi:hypothetical protein
MPYHLEKGPLLSVLDDFFNAPGRTRLATALTKLRAGDALTDIGLFDSPNLYNAVYPPPYQNRQQLVDHFKRDWLGDPLHPVAPNQTGHWQCYEGPVEAILRQTLIRATELVLGIPHGLSAANATRHWTIDFWWKCPQPWFEGWITWRQRSGSGKVTVIIATPADDSVVLRHPASEADPAPNQITIETEGSWVISCENHDPVTIQTNAPTTSGLITIATTGTRDTGDVVALAPKFGSGGARSGGMQYTGH